MRINSACGLILFCTVVKREAAAWSASRSQSRMEAPERARSMVARAAGQPHFCLATERLCGPPRVGRTFWFQIFIQAPSPEIWRKTISGGEGGCWRGKWGGLFLGYLLGRNYRRRDRDHLVPPRRMDAAVCRAEVCYPLSGAREVVGSETARVHAAEVTWHFTA